MTEESVTAISGAFNTAGADMIGNFVKLLPTMLGVAVLGFVVYTVYKLVKKIRKGGK